MRSHSASHNLSKLNWREAKSFQFNNFNFKIRLAADSVPRDYGLWTCSTEIAPKSLI